MSSLRTQLFCGILSVLLSPLSLAETSRAETNLADIDTPKTIEVQVIYPDQVDHGHTKENDASHTIQLALADMPTSKSTPTTKTDHPADHSSTSHQRIDVDQLVDMESLDPSEVFRFAPDYLALNPGDTIRFMNSLGKHTVLSIDSMMPDGAEPFAIAHQKVAEITFEQPGIYGIRCKVHTRYGMIMLVKVGDELPNLETAKKVKISKRAKKKFNKLFEQLEASL